MKQIITTAFAIFALSSFAQKPKKQIIKEWKYHIELTRPVKNNSTVFENDTIKASFSINMYGGGLDFEIQNKIQKTIKIDWNNSSFVWFGQSRGVSSRHKGQYERGQVILTTIPPMSKYTDFIKPDGYLNVEDSYLLSGSMFFFRPTGNKSIAYVEKLKNQKEFGILMPIIIDNKSIEYYFVFSLEVETIYKE